MYQINLTCFGVQDPKGNEWMWICKTQPNSCCALICQFCFIHIIMVSQGTHFFKFLQQSQDNSLFLAKKILKWAEISGLYD